MRIVKQRDSQITMTKKNTGRKTERACRCAERPSVRSGGGREIFSERFSLSSEV